MKRGAIPGTEHVGLRKLSPTYLDVLFIPVQAGIHAVLVSVRFVDSKSSLE